MPTLPLYHTPDVPNAWHRVTAPGGYEWWHFDAEDESGDVRVVARIYDGYAFHPGYLRATARYLRRPTRLAPPVPRDYPCAELTVYRGGAVWGRFVRVFPPGALTASPANLDVAVGPNRAITEKGELRLEMSDGGVAVELTFRPARAEAPVTIPLFEREKSRTTHRWTVVQPRCDVEGTVTCGGGEIVQFRGRGYHDHQFGTGPLSGIHGWIRGRATFADRTYTFHVTQPLPDSDAGERHLIIADGDGLRMVPAGRHGVSRTDRSGWGIRYPDQIGLAHGVAVNRPAVLDASPLRLHIAYLAWCEAGEGTAFCEVVRPGRLRWPVVGRVIERSIAGGNPPQ